MARRQLSLTVNQMPRGFDGHKKVKGRKRHLVTDTTGIPLMVKVTDANASEIR